MLSDNNIVSLGIASGDPRLHEMEAARQAEEDARAAEDQALAERREVYAVMLRAGMKHIEGEMKAKLRQAK